VKAPICLLFFLTGVLLATAEERAPRNPFWPQGYIGKRYPISVEPRFKPEPPPAVPEVSSDGRPADISTVQASHRAWTEALSHLRFGSVLRLTSEGVTNSSVLINGRAYTVGDTVSGEFGEKRFFWKIESLSNDGKIMLKPLKHIQIEERPSL